MFGLHAFFSSMVATFDCTKQLTYHWNSSNTTLNAMVLYHIYLIHLSFTKPSPFLAGNMQWCAPQDTALVRSYIYICFNVAARYSGVCLLESQHKGLQLKYPINNLTISLWPYTVAACNPILTVITFRATFTRSNEVFHNA